MSVVKVYPRDDDTGERRLNPITGFYDYFPDPLNVLAFQEAEYAHKSEFEDTNNRFKACIAGIKAYQLIQGGCYLQ